MRLVKSNECKTKPVYKLTSKINVKISVEKEKMLTLGKVGRAILLF